ncbi:MAG: acyltransferase family protein [Acidimicrobiales bacterium]
MPKPVKADQKYLPGLDGLRALAVAAVVAYHLGYGWAGGGYLGVDSFFVLSGFLITGLLIEERTANGVVRLRAFWARRARRLLPGLVTMLLLLAVWVALTKGGTPTDLGQLRSATLSTIFYVANWQQIVAHQSYWAGFAGQSPLKHTWTLAIEEQFYLLWPLVMALVLGGLHRRSGRSPGGRRSGPMRRGAHVGETGPRSWRRTGLTVTVGGTVLSAAWMAWLWHHGASVNRVYLGTDTRAFDLLAGAALAFLVAARPDPGPQARRALHVVGLAGAAVFGLCLWRAAAPLSQGPPAWMMDGGFLLVALAVAAVLADVRQGAAGPLGAVLRVRPLRWVGRISYGLYLWHFPIIVELTPERTGLNGLALDAERVACTFAAATLSYYLIERPVMKSRLRSWPRPARWALAPVALSVTAVLAVVATMPSVADATTAGAKGATVTQGAVPGAGGLKGQKPIVLAPLPSGAQPLRVTLLGDSVMFVEAPAIEAGLGATGVVDVTARAIVGWGLSTDHNWRQDVAHNIADSKARLVVAMWSWDDSWALAHPQQYKTVLEQFVRVVLAPGDGVQGLVFQQFPTPGPVEGDPDVAETAKDSATRLDGVRAWNRIAASMTKIFPGRVMYFPVGAAVELHGRFSTWLPPAADPTAPTSQWLRVRMVDNVHLCPAGAARYTDALLADLRRLYRLPPAAPGWTGGAWADDPRFSHSSGLSSTPCPADHPPA